MMNLFKKNAIETLGRKMQLLCSKLFTFHLTAKDNGFGCDKSIHCAPSLLEALLRYEPQAWENCIQVTLCRGLNFQEREKKKNDLQDGD